ncbi:DUF1080 domain-containing protein [uncultured Draconibacterium sp.]|uniref:3-keto-disaccharide hydrolase n=1 Tax=uncultured Draconibacterium sp. TaxID=1573823 RepID=UPI0025E0172A|nr:DUF1080 domain-containing protein [uncultured Draconibacterium sp.]
MTEEWGKPIPVVKPGKTLMSAPSDAIVLFDGTDLNKEWTDMEGSEVKWIATNGTVTIPKDGGDIKTKRVFEDFQLHVEWKSPKEVIDSGMRRGNSGIFLQGVYELQILDSYDNPTYVNGQAGSIYKQHAPLVNVCKEPGEWQVFDIIYTAPRFKGRNYFTPPYVTVLQNGVLILNNVAIKGPTLYIGIPEFKVEPHGAGPIVLQDHWFPVSFRNIWIREL